jgi:CyaY protein
MTESEFLALAELALSHIETEFERVSDAAELDIECSRSGNLLEIEFVADGARIIVNTQAPMQEIWVAAKAGGFHYRFDGHRWLDTRGGKELYVALSELAAAQAGAAVSLSPPA